MNGISNSGIGGEPFSFDDFLTVKKINTADLPKVQQNITVESDIIDDDEDLFGHGDVEHSGTDVNRYEQLQPNEKSQELSTNEQSNKSIISPIEHSKPKSLQSDGGVSQPHHSNDNSMMEEFETILQSTTLATKSPNRNSQEELNTEDIIEDNISAAGDVVMNNDSNLLVPEEDPGLANLKLTDERNETKSKPQTLPQPLAEEIMELPEEDILPTEAAINLSLTNDAMLMNEIDEDIAQEFVILPASTTSKPLQHTFNSSLVELPNESTLQPIPPSTTKKQPQQQSDYDASLRSMPGTSDLIWLQTKDHTHASSADSLTSNCPFMEQEGDEVDKEEEVGKESKTQKQQQSPPVPALALEKEEVLPPKASNNTNKPNTKKLKDKPSIKQQNNEVEEADSTVVKAPLSPLRLKQPQNPLPSGRKGSVGDVNTKRSNSNVNSQASLAPSASNESDLTAASGASAASSARRQRPTNTKPTGTKPTPPISNSNNNLPSKGAKSGRSVSSSSSAAQKKKDAVDPIVADSNNNNPDALGIAAISKPRTTRHPSNSKGTKKAGAGSSFLPSISPRKQQQPPRPTPLMYKDNNNNNDNHTLRSQDDSSTDTNSAAKLRRQQQVTGNKYHANNKLPRLPHSSPVATSSGSLEAIDTSSVGTGVGSLSSGSPTKKKHRIQVQSHSRKPLYLRMIAQANERLMEEEQERMEQYNRIKELKSKARPNHQLIKEHMMKYDELMKSKQEEFMLRQSSTHHNHIGQIRALRKHHHHSHENHGNNSITSGEDGTDASSLLSIGLSTPVRKQIVSSSGSHSARKNGAGSNNNSPGPLPFSPGHRNHHNNPHHPHHPHHRYDDDTAGPIIASHRNSPNEQIQNSANDVAGLLLSSPTRSSSPPKPSSLSLFSNTNGSLVSPTFPVISSISAPPPPSQSQSTLPDIPSDQLHTYLAPDWMALMATTTNDATVE